MADSVQQTQNTTTTDNSKNILLGKYEIGRLLGQGTFAKVHHGRNLATGESVAVKVINKKELNRDSRIMDQIKREISIMRLVKHPHVVELKEVMATKAKIFFVMEYVKGGELFAKVSKGRLKEDVARKYFQQLISAVDYCHSRGVYHRDLKPENLLLDENGDLKVSDFGLSALPENRWIDGLLHTQCGTPAYVAPEVLRKKGYGGAEADTWSCGVVLFVLLAGFLPFRDENLVKMYRKVFKAEYEFPKWFSSGARALISKLLVADPAKRITIPEIIADDWFRVGLLRITPDDAENSNPANSNPVNSNPAAPFYNAFELISSMSAGFDLSGLFSSKRTRAGTTFASKCSASGVVSRLRDLAAKKGLGFDLDQKGFRVGMRWREEGRKGRLRVEAEVFEVAPEVAVVELSKSSGDTLEYIRFCETDVRTALKDIVWTWQGQTEDGQHS